MKKFIEKSELIIKFWVFKFFITLLVFIALNLIFPEIRESIVNILQGSSVLENKISFLISLLLFLAALIYESITCYSAHCQANSSLVSARSQEEWDILKEQKFFLKVLPFIPIVLSFTPALGIIGVILFLLSIYSMYTFYSNHRTLKFLFNLKEYV